MRPKGTHRRARTSRLRAKSLPHAAPRDLRSLVRHARPSASEINFFFSFFSFALCFAHVFRAHARGLLAPMSAIVDFATARGPLVAILEAALSSGNMGTLREYLAALPGASRKTDPHSEKVEFELAAEPKALLELSIRTCLDRRVVRFYFTRKYWLELKLTVARPQGCGGLCWPAA